MTSNETTTADIQRAAAAELDAEADAIEAQIQAMHDAITTLRSVKTAKTQEARALRDAAHDAELSAAATRVEFEAQREAGLARKREMYGIEPLKIERRYRAYSRTVALDMLASAARAKDEAALERLRANTSVRAALTVQDD